MSGTDARSGGLGVGSKTRTRRASPTRLRVTGVVAAAALACAGLAACGSGGGSGGGNASSGNLTFLNPLGTEWQSALNFAVKQFQKANPNVKITIDNVPTASYQSALQTQMIAGDAPDVMLLDPPVVTAMSAQGFLAPLDNDLKTKQSNGQTWESTLTTGSLGLLTSGDGKNYAVPWSWIHIGFLYNKAQFQQWGIPAPPASGWTYDQMLSAMKTAKQHGEPGLYLGLGNNSADLWWQVTPMLDALLRPYTTQINLKHAAGWKYNPDDPSSVAGESYTADEQYIAFKRGFTDPAKNPVFKEAFQQLLRLKPYVESDIASYNPDNENPMFWKNQLLMVDAQPQQAGTTPAQAKAAGNPNLQVGYTDYPTITPSDAPGLTDGGRNPLVSVRNGISINAKTQNMALAVKFVKFLTSPSTVTGMYAHAGSTKGSYNIGEGSAIKGVTYPAGVTFAGIPEDLKAQISLFGFGEPPTYDNEDMDQYLAQFQNLWNGKITMTQFLQQRSASDLAALQRNLKLDASTVDQSLINKYVH